MNGLSWLKNISRVALVIWFAAVVAGSVSAQDTNALPLSEPGLYAVGTRELTFIDEGRNARELDVTVWYPAEEVGEEALPDLSGAPYPLILYSHGHGGNRLELAYLTQHLASYGFVVAAMEQKGHGGLFVPLDVVDQPMDVLFVLDQLAALSEGDLVGIFDSDNTGIAGYSGGGYDAIMVSGARWDDAYHWRWCAEHPGVYSRACMKTEQISAYREQFEPLPAQGELWQPLTDERIKAVLPLTGGPGPVFGERGLASARVPMLLIAGTADSVSPYEWAGVFVYEQWGGDERTLISIIGADHQFGYGSASPRTSVVMHFATAFFGYSLQGQKEYAQYLTEDFVDGVEGLVWGPVVSKNPCNPKPRQKSA
jgi:predicted dienelactone hydrolase